ncbi:hypothetical protein ACOSP7_002586 [Xanthoceras sorbifolium]
MSLREGTVGLQMTPRYLCRNKCGLYEQRACMANDRLWEYVSNEKLTRQHMLLFSCRPSSFFFIFNFCLLPIFPSLSRNQSPEQIFSGVCCSFSAFLVFIPAKQWSFCSIW